MRALDLCCGLGGWAHGLIAEGWAVDGIDTEETFRAAYPGAFCRADVRDVAILGWTAGSYDLIVASPPCQEFSRHDQPWTRRRNPPTPDLSIWRACEEIAKKIGCPLIVENVRGAQRWVGSARGHVGPYYLWGDVPLIPGGITWRKKESRSSSAVAERAMIPLEMSRWIGAWFSR